MQKNFHYSTFIVLRRYRYFKNYLRQSLQQHEDFYVFFWLIHFKGLCLETWKMKNHPYVVYCFFLFFFFTHSQTIYLLCEVWWFFVISELFPTKKNLCRAFVGLLNSCLQWWVFHYIYPCAFIWGISWGVVQCIYLLIFFYPYRWPTLRVME